MTSLHPLSDQAALASFAAEADALRFAAQVRAVAPVWLLDVVQAYTTVAVHFDLDAATYRRVAAELRRLADGAAPPGGGVGPLHVIPCCYERQLDLARVAGQLRLDAEQVIRLHAATEYTIYAIGFCPGFPYLGYLPPALSGVPRLPSPRLRVEPGSVGLTGRQTGVYTEPRPGGWSLIGRTPLVLVDVSAGYFPLRTGDRVRFERIGEAEYRRLEGKKLNHE
jgi:inhibitor of KinA